MDPRIGVEIKMNPDTRDMWVEFKKNPTILDFIAKRCGYADEDTIFRSLIEECAGEWLVEAIHNGKT